MTRMRPGQERTGNFVLRRRDTNGNRLELTDGRATPTERKLRRRAASAVVGPLGPQHPAAACRSDSAGIQNPSARECSSASASSLPQRLCLKP